MSQGRSFDGACGWLAAVLLLFSSIAVSGLIVGSSGGLGRVLLARHRVEYRLPFDDVHQLDTVVRRFVFDETPGALTNDFQPGEVRHLADVRSMVQRVYRASGYLLTASLVTCLGWVVWPRPGDRRHSDFAMRVVWLFRRAAFASAGVAIFCLATGLLFFEAAFEVMHRLLFVEGTYSFSLGDSKLVALYPELFFRDIVVAFVLVLVGSNFLLLVGVRWFLRGRSTPVRK